MVMKKVAFTEVE